MRLPWRCVEVDARSQFFELSIPRRRLAEIQLAIVAHQPITCLASVRYWEVAVPPPALLGSLSVPLPARNYHRWGSGSPGRRPAPYDGKQNHPPACSTRRRGTLPCGKTQLAAQGQGCCLEPFLAPSNGHKPKTKPKLFWMQNEGARNFPLACVSDPQLLDTAAALPSIGLAY